jgi:hypothetical protein
VLVAPVELVKVPVLPPVFQVPHYTPLNPLHIFLVPMVVLPESSLFLVPHIPLYPLCLVYLPSSTQQSPSLPQDSLLLLLVVLPPPPPLSQYAAEPTLQVHQQAVPPEVVGVPLPVVPVEPPVPVVPAAVRVVSEHSVLQSLETVLAVVVLVLRVVPVAVYSPVVKNQPVLNPD